MRSIPTFCGRNALLSETERSRLHWRSTKPLISSCAIHVWTSDEVSIQALVALDILRDIQAGG
ncbi:hypothetical protein [Methylobacterium sp. JK268]